MRIFKNKKAQSTAEYAIVLGLVIGAVIAMQTYVKRGLQGRVRQAADYRYKSADATQPDIFKTAGGYEPYYLSSNFTSTKSGASVEDVYTANDTEGAGAVLRNITDASGRTGHQVIDTGAGTNETVDMSR